MSEDDESADYILERRFALEEELSSVSSLTGEQCEALAQERPQHGSGRTGKLIKFADKAILARGLTAEEMAVCRLRFGTTAGLLAYDRLVSLHELADVEQWQGEVLVPGDAGRIAENPDLRMVVGVKARPPTNKEIADALGLTERQVKSRLASARGKVRARQRSQAERQRELEDQEQEL